MAIDRLMGLVYEPLRSLANRHFQHQPASHTLQPTALVHEVSLRVVDRDRIEWQDRAHFFAVCSRAMRGILVDHARRMNAAKRGRDGARVTLDDAFAAEERGAIDLLDLEEHLTHLATLNERHARIVECRFFSGMTIPEVASALGVSERTVTEDWTMARAWLGARLERSGEA